MSRSTTWASAALVMAVMSIGTAVQAADISMNADDAAGSSSFNSGLHWVGGAAPATGNNYFNANFMLRTPANGTSYTFGGDALTITSDQAFGTQLNDALMYKGTASSTMTINNCTVNGGALRHANGEAQTFTLAGNGLTVGSGGMIVHVQGPLVITAPVLGSGVIRIVDNGSNDARRTLHFASAANTFNGNIELPTANRSRFTLDAGANLLFTIGTSGINNKISGPGVGVFNGMFKFDLTSASANLSDTWTIVDVATVVETFATTFAVDGFLHYPDNTWAKAANGAVYTFNPATGALSVTAVGVTNLPPGVDAGPNQSVPITIGTTTLAGVVADDGLPNPPGAMSMRWTIDSQPVGSTLTFSDNTVANPTVTYDLVGDYVLRLTACDNGTPGACLGNEVSDTMTMTVTAGYTWDGGGASDNWSLSANWVGDYTPLWTGGVSTLVFTGSTRLTPNNDVAGVDLKALQFDAAAGAFTLGGQGVTVQSAITNDSANAQAINTTSVALGSRQVIVAGASNVNVATPVIGAGGLVKNGAGVLSIPGANQYLGFTTVNEGTLNVSTATGLGLAPISMAGATFVDAVGDAGGNTVRNSDGDPSAFWTTATLPGDNLWFSWSNVTGTVTTTFIESGPDAEDTPLIRTTLTGLTPGATYTLGVVYWSGPTEDWSIRAGLAADQLTAFDRSGTGAVAGTFTGTSIVFSWGSAIQLVASLGATTADGSGQIIVYVDDLPTTGGGNRCWYDGLVYWPGTMSAGEGTLVAGGTSTAAVQLAGDMTSAEQFVLAGRSPSASHIGNLSGNNALTGTISLTTGGSEYAFESVASQLTIGDIINNTGNATVRNLHLTGAANGVVAGTIVNGAATGNLVVLKEGAGTWTLANNSPDLDTIIVSAGTLALSSAAANNVPDANITISAGAILDVTGLNGGSIDLSTANSQILGGAGQINGMVVAESATTLNPGLGTTGGTLAVSGGVILKDGSTLKLRLGSDLLRVTGGALTGANVGGVSLFLDTGTAPVGTYTLIDWSGAAAAGVDVADFVITGAYGPCAGGLRIDGSTLVIDYNPTTAPGKVDDFQSYAVGRVDALVNAPWQVTAQAGTQFVAIDTDTGNQYLRFQTWDGAGTEGRGGYRPLGCGRIPEGQTRTLFFRWYVPAPTGTMYLNHYMGLADNAYAPVGTNQTDIDNLLVRTRLVPGTTTGTVQFQYANGTTDTNGRDNLLTDTWYNVWVVVRNDSGTAGDVCDYYVNTGDVSVNGATDLVAAGVPFRAGLAADLAKFSAVAWLNTARNIVRIDDLYVMDGENLVNPLFPYGGFDFVEPWGYVDAADYTVFLNCMTGPAVSGPPVGCGPQDFLRADTDRDNDVDLVDFGRFQQCFGGTNPADPHCGTW